VLGPLGGCEPSAPCRLTLITSQVSFTLQPRVFDERFPSKVLYVNGRDAAGHAMAWRISGRNWRSTGAFKIEHWAENAIVIAEPKQGKLNCICGEATTHEFSRRMRTTTPSRHSARVIGPSNSAAWQPSNPAIEQSRAFDSRAMERCTSWLA